MTALWPGRVLCRIDQLAQDETRAITLDGDPSPEVFVVRRGDRVYAYRNSCPHTGAPLDWVEHQFLNPERTLIQCATHAALFRIEDGYCVAGPCAGARLTALPVTVCDGAVVLAECSASPRG